MTSVSCHIKIYLCVNEITFIKTFNTQLSYLKGSFVTKQNNSTIIIIIITKSQKKSKTFMVIIYLPITRRKKGHYFISETNA